MMWGLWFSGLGDLMFSSNSAGFVENGLFQTRCKLTSLKTYVLQKNLEVYLFLILRGVRCGGILAEGTINF